MPSPVSSFVGRRQELGEIEQLLEDSRLVSLTGPGGIGKTRLAMEVAGRMRDRFDDGLWWVDLAPVGDPDQVRAAVAETLGVRPQPHTPLVESIVQALVRRTALLLVDNCEHLARPVAELVTAVIRGTRHVRILTTSRSILHVPGEVRWVVPPLTMPTSGSNDPAVLRLSDAVLLFSERAVAADVAEEVLDAARTAQAQGVPALHDAALGPPHHPPRRGRALRGPRHRCWTQATRKLLRRDRQGHRPRGRRDRNEASWRSSAHRG